jgi:hypothetical protein
MRGALDHPAPPQAHPDIKVAPGLGDEIVQGRGVIQYRADVLRKS